MLALISVNFNSCNAQKNNKAMENEITKITYHYGDSSVPPPYHRSYSITVTANLLEIKVDSYGEVLAEKKIELEEGKMDALVKVLTDSKIENCEEKKNDGCCGGTSETLSYFSHDERIFHGSVYHCGGSDYGTMKGDLAAFTKELKALIPNFSDMLK